MPGLQDPFSGNPQRAWQRRANPFCITLLHLAPESRHRALANESHANVYILLSGFAAALAISIRPNYLFSIPAFVLFSVVTTARTVTLEKYTHAIKQVTLFILAASLMIVFQFVPYFLHKNGPSVLLSALLATLHFSSGSSSMRIFHEQFFTKLTASFYLFMYLGVGTMLLVAIVRFRAHRTNLTDSIILSGTLFCLASIVGISYSCIRTHYIDHYSIMYVPYASVIFTYLCVLLCRENFRSMKSGVRLCGRF
jgi:hypothetical protein